MKCASGGGNFFFLVWPSQSHGLPTINYSMTPASLSPHEERPTGGQTRGADWVPAAEADRQLRAIFREWPLLQVVPCGDPLQTGKAKLQGLRTPAQAREGPRRHSLKFCHALLHQRHRASIAQCEAAAPPFPPLTSRPPGSCPHLIQPCLARFRSLARRVHSPGWPVWAAFVFLFSLACSRIFPVPYPFPCAEVAFLPTFLPLRPLSSF